MRYKDDIQRGTYEKPQPIQPNVICVNNLYQGDVAYTCGDFVAL